ncbi:MAG: hypothetical protein QM315_07520 [Bacillota bacterium]|jgi:hypothetical protein|nr:hypothetical protein [Bacillota bacterium]NLV63094.1 hypothetical protein [Clostridiaceae bacterium]
MSGYNDFGVFGAFAVLMAVLSFILVIVGIAFYIFFSFTLYKLAQKRGLEMPWLAWIPIAQFYVLGMMVKSVKISTFEVPKLEMVFPIASIACWILGMIPFIGWLFTLAFYAFTIIVLYNLYNQYTPEKAKTYALISILGVTIPFIIKKLHNMEPVNLP